MDTVNQSSPVTTWTLHDITARLVCTNTAVVAFATVVLTTRFAGVELRTIGMPGVEDGEGDAEDDGVNDTVDVPDDDSDVDAVMVAVGDRDSVELPVDVWVLLPDDDRRVAGSLTLRQGIA